MSRNIAIEPGEKITQSRESLPSRSQNMRLRPEVMGYWGDLKQRSATPQGGRAVTFAFGEWQHENFLEKETLRTSQIETPHWLVAPPDISLSCRTGGPLQSELLHSARALGAYLLLGSGSSLCEVRPKPPSMAASQTGNTPRISISVSAKEDGDKNGPHPPLLILGQTGWPSHTLALPGTL
jgi:hypothetical protein